MVNLISAALLILGAAVWAVVPNVLGLPDAAALWFGVISAALLQIWRLWRENRTRRRNLLTTATAVGRLSRGFDPVPLLGLRRSARALREAVEGGASAGPAALPPYVPGAVDAQLDSALAAGSFALVVGNAFSGKSRAAYEALRRDFAAAEVWVPSGPEGLRALLECDPPPPAGWRPVVIWLDDLDYFLDRGAKGPEGAAERGESAPATAALLARHLAKRPWWRAWRTPRLVVLATISRREYDGLVERAVDSEERRERRRWAEVVALAERVELADGPDAGWDMREADRLYPGVDFARGIGRAFAEGDALAHAYRHGSDAVGCALVRAAVDWRRIGAGRPARRVLRDLLAAELPGKIVDEEEFERGLRWANREIADGQRPLAERSGDGAPTYEAHSYLLDVDEGYGPDADPRPVPAAVWDAAIASLDVNALFAIGAEAAERDPAAAERILLHLLDIAADFGSEGPIVEAYAQLDLGSVYRGMPGREADAEACLAAAAAGADPDVRVLARITLAQMQDMRTGPEPTAETEKQFAAALAVEGASPSLLCTARYERGVRRLSDGRERDAEADFSAVIAAEDVTPETQAWAHVKRSVIYRGDSPERRRSDLDAALRLHADPGSDAIAYISRADMQEDVELRLRDFAAAIESEASPSWRGAAHCLRAETLAKLGEYERGEADYDAALALDGITPDEKSTWLVDRSVTLKGRDHARDLADCTAAIELDGVRDDTRGQAYMQRGMHRIDDLVGNDRPRPLARSIAADLDRAIELSGDDGECTAESHYLRGKLLNDGYGTADSAIADFTTAITTAGATPHTVASSYIHRALVHASERRYRQAEEDFAAGIETPEATPRSVAVGFIDRGIMREALGHSREAEADYRAAVAVEEGKDPSAGALRHLADLLRGSGRVAEERAVLLDAARSGRPELVAVALPRLEANARRAAARRQRRNLRSRRRSAAG